MPMNVKPISTVDERIRELRMRTAKINRDILPNDSHLWASQSILIAKNVLGRYASGES